MNDIKYLILTILMTILTGLLIVAQIIEPSLSLIFLIIIGVLSIIGGIILYLKERNDSRRIYKYRNKYKTRK